VIVIGLLVSSAGWATEIRPVYTVQVGSFTREANARSMRARLDDHFTDVTILSDRVAERVVYRVLSGRFASRDQAQARRRALDRLGFDTLVRRLEKSPVRAGPAPRDRPAWKIVADQIEAGLRLRPPDPAPDAVPTGSSRTPRSAP
jgi:hypothetical protein